MACSSSSLAASGLCSPGGGQLALAVPSEVCYVAGLQLWVWHELTSIAAICERRSHLIKWDGIESARLLSPILFSAHGLATRESTGGPGASSSLILGLLPGPQPRWHHRETAEILGTDLKSEVQSPSPCASLWVGRELLTGVCRPPGGRRSWRKLILLRGTLPSQSELSFA